VKEAVFKAWYPLAHTELGFLEAEVAFQVDGDGFFGGVTAEVRRPGPFAAVSGRWRVADGVIATAVVAEAGASWKSGQRPSRAAPPGEHPAA
jgi:4'-phosphopantetheinyl transferase EntD